MSGELDANLLALSTPAGIRAQYVEYKRDKIDKLRAQGTFTGADLAMSQGASLEEVLTLDELEADFPITEYVTAKDGRKKRIINIPMGADGVTFQAFEKELPFRAVQISNRIKENHYLFYPFREVVIPKDRTLDKHRPPSPAEVQAAIDTDRVRILAIASIRDVIVQNILYKVLGKAAEEQFTVLDKPIPVSYAYRPGKSAPVAARAVRRHIKSGYAHALDADLSKFFDGIPREALLNICRDLIGDNPLTFQLLRRFVYVERVRYQSYHWARDTHGRKISDDVFFTTRPGEYVGIPRRDRPQRYKWTAGVPQGGVLSGLLANLYLHSFDQWIRDELALDIELRYVRYADDFVILTRSRSAVIVAYERTREKLETPVEQGGLGLTMHHLDFDNPNAKTRYINTSAQPIKFVGFAISPENLSIHPDNINKHMLKWQAAVASETELRSKYPEPRERLQVLIKQKLRFKIIGYQYPAKCPRCSKLREKRRSWIAFFSSVTDWQQIRSVDEWMRRIIYKQFRAELPNLTRADLTKLGLPSLMREYHRLRKMRGPCPGCESKKTTNETIS
jgi:RNA-directed DNA polymerase